MTEPVKIPDLVTARVELHAAETRVRLETVKAQLSGEALSTALSRRLRSQRDRLAEELAAWEYLSAHVGGQNIFHGLRERFPREKHTTQAGIAPAECESCGHRHISGDMCTVMLNGGHCGCKR